MSQNEWDPCGFSDNKWDPCGFEDFCIRNVTMHQSKAVNATALPAKSLLSTIPLPPSSALPSPSTRRLQDPQSLTPDAPNDRNTSSDATERPAGFVLNIHKQSFPEEEKAAVAAFFELTGTTSVDAAKTGTTSAHSAHRSDDTFVAEVWRILEAKDDREVLGFKCAEPLTLQEAMSHYRQLALQLHSDKRTETGIAKAGGFQVCELAWMRLTHARIWADRTLKKKTTTQTAPFYQSRSAASLHPSDISVARQPKLEVGFPRATAISQEQETPHLCSCGKCYDYCQYYTKALDCWVPCCFSWFIGLHTCPHIIKAELTLEPKCRLQNDGKTVWLGLFVTAMKLKNDDWGDSVNGTYDLHQWDFHCTIGVFRLTKKATVHSRLTPVELWDQKMLQIGVSHRKCNCCIKRVLDEEEVDWYKQWKICYGGDALTSARNTMMQCFPFNHHGPPVEVMRTFQAWRPGLFLHLSAYNKKRDNNSLTTSLCTSATDRFAAAVTDDC